MAALFSRTKSSPIYWVPIIGGLGVPIFWQIPHFQFQDPDFIAKHRIVIVGQHSRVLIADVSEECRRDGGPDKGEDALSNHGAVEYLST